MLTRACRAAMPIVLLDDGEGLAARAFERFIALGFSQVALLAGGLDGWIRAGGEVFRDVNVPSKARSASWTKHSGTRHRFRPTRSTPCERAVRTWWADEHETQAHQPTVSLTATLTDAGTVRTRMPPPARLSQVTVPLAFLR